MRTALTALAAATALTALSTSAVLVWSGSATASTDGQVCSALTSGKIDTKGDPQTVTISAPPGQEITGYCVKAGSAQQGDGPAYFTLGEPVSNLTFGHPSRKAVSHYSFTYRTVSSATSTPSTGTPTTSTPSTGTPSTGTPSTGTPSTGTPTETPTTGTPPTGAPSEAPTGTPTQTQGADPTDAPPGTNPPAVDPHGNFDWNWRYADPTCSALEVAYPSNIPEGQSNDINVRVWTDSAGEITLNYHNNDGTWSGNRAFVYQQHKNWPAGVTRYAVIWTQVAGSNYHYGEKFHQEPAKAPLTCRINDDGNAETYDVPLAETGITGFDTSTVTVARRTAARADVVVVTQPGLQQLVLEKQVGLAWQTVSATTPRAGATTVTFPRERRRGTYRYRLVVPASESITGTTSGVLTVRVR